MKKVKIHLIAAARPNFMKVAPLYHELKKKIWCKTYLIHTGQHYDSAMSDAFLKDLMLPRPDAHLGVGSGMHAEQTARVMLKYERLCLRNRPDLVVVVGDVNSTMAAAITAKKLNILVAHLEAGLRSGDISMPEEINRITTDLISDILWTPSPDASENLRKSGVPKNRIIFVGNIMIDSYEMLKEKISAAKIPEKFALKKSEYCVVTLHRPSNVDTKKSLSETVNLLLAVSKLIPIVFPVHPRTLKRLTDFNLLNKLKNSKTMRLEKPMGYIDFMSLVKGSRMVITDSGGIQEETTYLNIPCLTLRTTTERPITITQGTNRLVNSKNLLVAVKKALNGLSRKSICPKYWDGKTADRIVKSIKNYFKIYL